MNIVKKHPKIITPCYGTEESAGLDLWLDPTEEDENLILHANESRMYDVGLRVSVPKGYYAAILPRGGSGCKGLVIGNLEGVIDSDYTGELFVCLWNRTDTMMKINKSKAVAQMIIKPYKKETLHLVDSLDDTSRGDGCLGHTDGEINE